MKEIVVYPTHSTAVSVMGLESQLAVESFTRYFGNVGHAEISFFFFHKTHWVAVGSVTTADKSDLQFFSTPIRTGTLFIKL